MSPAPTRKPGEATFAVLLLVFAVAAFWQSYDISGFRGLTKAGVFPMLASGTMVLAGLLILLSTLRKTPSRGSFVHDVLPLRHGVLIGMVLGYVATMPALGFTISSGLFLAAAFQFLWRKNPLVTLALTALALGAIYLVFREVFQVVLPQGTLLRGWS